jgi:hypothetical protein
MKELDAFRKYLTEVNNPTSEVKGNVLYLDYKDTPSFGGLKSKTFKVSISGPKDEPKNQKYMIYWKEDSKDWEWEAGEMKRQLRSSIISKAKKQIPIK